MTSRHPTTIDFCPLDRHRRWEATGQSRMRGLIITGRAWSPERDRSTR